MNTNTVPVRHSRSRQLGQISEGFATSDGDGVQLTRIIGTAPLPEVDPFLMLDAFGSDQPLDYIGGFPSHPHRGFEAVTYLLAGRVRHKDSAGNEGVIEAGGVQWMTAGRGIVHSEMPEQQDGLLMGFQLWVNLPAKDKMTTPKYQEFTPDEVPLERWQDGTEIRVIAGTTTQGTTGPVINHFVQPLYMDVLLQADQIFEQAVPIGDNSFIYIIEGKLEIGHNEGTGLKQHQLGLLEPNPEADRIHVRATSKPARFILVSAQPLNEPIARGGPFVMNTEAEVRQAFDDFRHNRF